MGQIIKWIKDNCLIVGILITTIWAIVKKFKSTGDDIPGRGRVSILAPHTEDALSHQTNYKVQSWRIANASWVLGSESLQNYDQTTYKTTTCLEKLQ